MGLLSLAFTVVSSSNFAPGRPEHACKAQAALTDVHMHRAFQVTCNLP